MCLLHTQVPTGSRTAKGVPVPQVLPLTADERISSVIPVEDFKDDEFLVLLTKVRAVSSSTYAFLMARPALYPYRFCDRASSCSWRLQRLVSGQSLRNEDAVAHLQA